MYCSNYIDPVLNMLMAMRCDHHEAIIDTRVYTINYNMDTQPFAIYVYTYPYAAGTIIIYKKPGYVHICIFTYQEFMFLAHTCVYAQNQKHTKYCLMGGCYPL